MEEDYWCPLNITLLICIAVKILFCSSTGCFTMRIYELCVDGFLPGSGQKDKLIGKAVRRPEKLLFPIKTAKTIVRKRSALTR